ncbi:MAG: DsbE family thiol:disulfide interchange protein [Alphaproteobacteria bacterium]|nr:DsbE family thiol:disulfide interchange protein [Alphaproteobacteria bacterium]
MRRLWAFAPLAALALIVIAGAVTLLSGRERETISAGLTGQELPAFALPMLQGGETLEAARLAGRPYIVNVFASYCGPCRVEHPLLLALKARGVPVVGMAYKDDPADTARFLNELGDPFTAVMLDRDGRYGLEIGVTGMPETYVIGADGRILLIHRGALDEATIARDIAPVFEL